MTMPTVTVGPVLPSQDPRTLEEKILQVQQQRELLSEMRAQSDPGVADDARHPVGTGRSARIGRSNARDAHPSR